MLFLEIIAWILIIASFVIAFIGLVYPIIPSVLFILLGFIMYGLFYSFADLGWLFWVIEILFVVLLFAADSVSNLIGVKKFGGTKAGMWGSTIGLICWTLYYSGCRYFSRSIFRGGYWRTTSNENRFSPSCSIWAWFSCRFFNFSSNKRNYTSYYDNYFYNSYLNCNEKMFNYHTKCVKYNRGICTILLIESNLQLVFPSKG